ncbi:PREDICTED: WUSCHEL-related homeobox 8-like [Nelumbo nucifera]|uniref:Homeobox domain-containing protein n=2 Tax=Nelumbo nucifera TaxID=4432 RepID=A0A822ZNR5_NELNU|nr:PREDICTED: WUSCHEL-related homeobox 8-like [Nelumbo nucifera]DAD46537.1 TPA_asm: hypothetical protein HUJ06_016474 [Nelumbo nucifera]
MGTIRNGGETKEEMKMMEWEKQEQQQQQQNGVMMYVKVMTDEQMELLRKQISIYATICEELVEMHKAITAQRDLAGMRLGNLYFDPLMTSSGHKITARQRWTPAPIQLQILERIFDQGNGTPSKQKIKEITSELAQHGQISETNVYNWFQNRRARSKRKQQVAVPNNAESEIEIEVESPDEKKAKPEIIHLHENQAPSAEDMCYQSPGIISALHSVDPQHNKAESIFSSDNTSKSSVSLSHLSFYESVLSNSGYDHLIGKMEGPGSFNPYRQGEGYDMIG